MQIKMEVARPDDVVVTLTITATIKEWRRVHGAMDGAGLPGHPLVSAISDAAWKLQAEALGVVEGTEDGA